MNAVHPGPNAGDGLEIEQSRYIKKADKLDNMIECAQCGWIVDLTKRPTGNSLGAVTPSGTQLTGAVVPAGSPVPYVSWMDNWYDIVDANSGCPFCNSKNPQAIDRGKTGFEKPHRSVENL